MLRIAKLIIIINTVIQEVVVLSLVGISINRALWNVLLHHPCARRPRARRSLRHDPGEQRGLAAFSEACFEVQNILNINSLVLVLELLALLEMLV